MDDVSTDRATPARAQAQPKCSSSSGQTFPWATCVLPREYLVDSLCAYLSCGNCKNGNASPDEIYKSGRIGYIENRVCVQEQTDADIKELVGSRVTFQFLMGYHCISNQESGCAHPADRIKPEMTLHSCKVARTITSELPFLRELLF